MKHGADILSYSDQYDLIDFSSNINPLGYPPGLPRQIMDSFDQVMRYPDIRYRSLKASVAEYLGVDRKQVIVGNGAMDIIDRLMMGEKHLMVIDPCFSEYELRARVHGLNITHVSTSPRYQLDLDRLCREMSPGSVVVLGNPNNPTGQVLRLSDLSQIYQRCLETDSQLIIDETFVEFADLEADALDFAKHHEFDRISIIRAATKFFGLPGLRLGYGVVHEDVKKSFEHKQTPWAVNQLAVVAAESIFQEREYIQQTIATVKAQRHFLSQAFQRISFLDPIPSHANFILVHVHEKPVREIFEALLEEKILIRTCDSFQGLHAPSFRVAVKNAEDNQKLVHQLNQLEEKNG